MNKSRTLDLWATGLAIFAMFFGAGNIIFPLAIGHYALDQTPFAIGGLLITAVLMPFVGLLAMFLFRGETKPFFGRLGERGGLFVALMIMALLGPLGSTPRCIALAYSTFQMTYPSISAPLFSFIACLLIFLAVYKKRRLLSILGYVLTPVLVFCLGFIIVKGLIQAPMATIASNPETPLVLFWHGLKEGYNTMDLLAAFFFAPVIIHSIRVEDRGDSQKKISSFILKASVIGALLLSLVYIGFSYLASYYAPYIGEVSSDKLLAAIALHILGNHAGLVVNSIVTLACLTTAIALMAAFCQFMQRDVLRTHRYDNWVLLGSLVVTFIMATFEFQSISAFLAPILQLCYPALILLTLLNIGYSMYDFKPVRSLFVVCLVGTWILLYI
jgi:LIVCS family branched-chain amino acid:cation transporter